jgi:predicted permease
MLVAGIACGLPSALHSARLDLRGALSLASRSVVSEPRGMRLLTAIEVALACVLLVGASLLFRSLARLEVVDPGFRADNVVVSPFTLGAASGSAYDDSAARARFLDGIVERSRAVPGVELAGVTSSMPFTFSPNALLEEEGVPLPKWGQAPVTHYRVIGGDYFQALRVPLKAGRFFDERDRAGAQSVAIVNEATVRQMWNGADALGRRVRMTNMDGVQTFATIVGVVGDMRHRGLTTAPVSEIFFPYAQRPGRTYSTTLVVRSSIAPASVTDLLRAAVREADAAVPSQFALLGERLDRLLAPARFRTRLLAVFAIVALGLAAVGLFAVMSYSVARRTREIGIRMALGADAGTVRRLIIARGMTPVLAGTVAGAWIALVGARWLSGLVFDISPRDPWAFAAAIVVLPVTALLAIWIPARRATRIDPTVALRSD